VLDRILHEPWLRIEAISGTSAGTMNAAVVSNGYAADGSAGARVTLERCWRCVSEAARLSPLQRSPVDILMGRWTMDNSPFFVSMDIAARLDVDDLLDEV
jgi:NTE family protein